MMKLIMVGVFFEILFLVLVLSGYMLQRKPISRINQYVEIGELRKNKRMSRVKLPKTNFKGAFHVLGNHLIRLFALNRYGERLEKQLIRGDIPLKAEEMIFIMLFAVFFTFSIGIILTSSWISSTVLSVIIFFVIRTALKSKEKKRIREINEQLGDSLGLMAGALRVGHSFAQAIEAVANQMPLPISKEFHKVVREMELGMPVEKAMENLIERVPCDDLELLATAVVIQRQIGGNLAEILDNISETIRDRIRLKSEVKVLTAQGRISGLIVGLLPIAFVLIILILNPAYMKTLITDPLGWILIFIAIMGQVIGILFVKKIIDIQY